MLDIYNLLSKAVNLKDPHYCCILFEHDCLIAGDNDLAARVPYKNEKELLIESQLLGKALKATKGGDIVYNVESRDSGFVNTLELSKGKRHIVLASGDPALYMKTGVLNENAPDVDWQAIDVEFTNAMIAVSEAMSDDASKMWSMAVSLHNNKLIATDGKALFFGYTPIDGSVVFPARVIEFLKAVAQHEYPTHFGVIKNALAFKFESELIITCKRIEDERQEQVAGLIERAFKKPEFVVTPELKDAIESAASIGEFIVELRPNSVKASCDGATFEEEIETGVPADLTMCSYDTKKVLLLLKGIKKIAFGKEVACADKGDNVFAMITRRGR